MVNVEAFQGMITCQLLQIKLLLEAQPVKVVGTLATTTDILLCSNLLACFIRRVPGHYWKGGQFFLFFLMLQECCRPTQHPTTDSNVHKSFTALHSKMSGKVSRVPEAAKELLKNRAFYSSRLWRNWDAIEGYMFGEKMIPKNDSNLYTQAWIQGALL